MAGVQEAHSLATGPRTAEPFISQLQQIAGAHEAIFGHSSAHSLATGPWIAEPFISPLSFTIYAGVVLEVNKHTFSAPPWLALPDHHAFQDLLSKLWLSLLASAKDHVTRGTIRKLVQAATNAAHCHDVQVLRTGVVRAIHGGCPLTTKG